MARSGPKAGSGPTLASSGHMANSGPTTSSGVMAHFHEIPLVLFSALATAGGGVGAAHMVAGFLGGSWALSDARALLLSGLLLLAAVLSLGHLGRPGRGPLALLGLGRSPLSNEIGALGLALALGASSLVLPWGPWTPVIGFLASLASAFFLLTLGWVYVLPGQVAWGRLGAASPLVLGFTWGLLLDAGLPGGIPASTWPLTFWPALLLDGVLTGVRWLSLERAAPGADIAHPRIFPRRRILLGSRLALTTLAAPAALLAGAWPLGVLFFAGALLLDRLGFYALALRRTTESEVRRVESLLRP
ncbi:MAG: hypothetical protein ACQET1_07305 [Gemmatimonadota bacterium]